MKLFLCGDVMLGENLFHLGRGIRTKYKQKYQQIIDPKIRDSLINETDVFLFNFEYSLIDPYSKLISSPDSMVYRGDIESLKFIEGYKGIVIANIANNHFSQHGFDSGEFTKKKLQDNNIKIIGGISGNNYSFNNGNVEFKIWGASMVEDSYYCNNYWFVDADTIIQYFSKFEKRANEYWILSIHWGDEYIVQPSHKQIQLAHQLIDLGIDIILGHHSHVVQSVEIYKSKYIFYSFGNFIFDQNFSKETQTGLAVVFNTENPIETEFFLTFQKKYTVTTFQKISIDDLSLVCLNDYLSILEKRKKYFRKSMKKEYMKNIFLTNHKVLFKLIRDIL